MIIDCHGRYTTAPKQLQIFRDRQLAGLTDSARRPADKGLGISDDQVAKAMADQRPDVVGEIYRLLVESKNLAPLGSDRLDFHPMGVEANRKALELMVHSSVEQQIIPRAVTVDECFDGTASALGSI